MSKPAGKCVFCDKPGLTKGHVWPDWLNNILPRTATRHEEVVGEFSTFTPEVPGPPKDYRVQTRSREIKKTAEYLRQM